MIKKQAIPIEDQILHCGIFMASPRANSSIKMTLCAWKRADVTSKPLCTLTLTQIKKIIFGTQIPNPNAIETAATKELFTSASVLGLRILDSALCLTQHRKIKELARREARSCSNMLL